MIREGEQPCDSESISKDGPPISEQVLGQTPKTTSDIEGFPSNCLRASFNDAVKDTCEALVVDRESENLKCQVESEALSRDGGKAALMPIDHKTEGRRPSLDLSVTPPGMI